MVSFKITSVGFMSTIALSKGLSPSVRKNCAAAASWPLYVTAALFPQLMVVFTRSSLACASRDRFTAPFFF